MLIEYKAVVINGIDKTGQVEDVPDAQAIQMIELGYAVKPGETVKSEENTFEAVEKKTKRGKHAED